MVKIIKPKQGMEMWQLVIMILCLLLLLAIIIWYGFLGGELSKLFTGLEDWLYNGF